MTATTIRVQMAQRKDTAANWTAANPILLSGEIGYETDTKKFKIGNGSTAWNSLAYLPIPDGSGNLTITGNLEIGSTGSLTFEGSTADGFETTLAVTNPTADRTITLPDVTGTVVTTGDTGSVTSTMIANGTIVDADISSTAEIAVSKLANGTANQVIVTDGTNVSWSDNLTLAGDLTVNGTTTTINTQDLLVEDKNIIIGNVATPSDVTADGGGITLKGATDKTINWVDATDAWTLSEHVNVASGKEYRIAGTKVLDATSLGSSVLITSANITDGTIVDGDISATAEIAVSKLADGAARQLLQTDAAGTGVEWASNIDIPGTLDVTGAATFDSSVAVTGTLTKSGSNVVTVGDTGTVTSTMILDGTILNADVNASAAIAGTKISPDFGSQNVTTTGTSTAASFIPTSSTAPTNGLYLSAANSVALSSNGTERLRITSTGLVGLGTSSPSARLHVSDGNILISNAYYLSARNNANTSSVPLIGRNTSDNVVIDPDGYGTWIGFGPTLVTTSAGRVGIGTSSPVAPLHVSGSGVFARLTDTQAYNFGTSGPILDFTGNDSSGASILFARLQGSPNNGNPDRGFLNILTRVNGVNTSTLQVGTGLAADVFVPNGRLGIGTTTVNSLLEVRGTSDSQNIIHLSNAAGASDGAVSNVIRVTCNGNTNWANLITSASQHFYNVNGTEAMRLDSSRRLLVGTSSARANFFNSTASAGIQLEAAGDISAINRRLSVVYGDSDVYGPYIILGKHRSNSIGGNTVVQSGDEMGGLTFQGSDGSEFVEAARIQAFVDGTPGANDMPGRLVFSTTADGASSPTERMRIRNSGISNFYADSTGLSSATNAIAGTTSAVFIGRHTATSTTTGTDSFVVWSNGNVQNTNNSYTAISDIKLKENIVDASSQWEDIKSLRVCNYNLKEGQTHRQIGLIAQEVEPISPGLVYESPDRDAEGNDLGTTTKSVNYSVLYMKAVKALQEAMERIELLEARLDAANL